MREWLSRTAPRFSYRAGLETLAVLWPAATEPVPYPHADETAALRGDFLRVGEDLRGVIKREAAREQIETN